MVMVLLEGGQGEIRGAYPLPPPKHPKSPPRTTPNRPTWTPPPLSECLFFSVSFCPCLPGPLGLDKLPPTSPLCPLTA